MQQFINKRLVDAAKRYRVVVRLKGGDPMIFGRAQEEIAALEEAGSRVRSGAGHHGSACRSGCASSTSLTQRGSARSVTFATPRVGASEPDSTWARGLAAADAGAIYMGVGEAARIAQTLIASGKPPGLPVAIVESASLPEQRIRYTTLADLPRFADASVAGPALILFGPQFRARAIEVAERCTFDEKRAAIRVDRSEKAAASGFSWNITYTRIVI